MKISVICPCCDKTVAVERTAKITCPECGNTCGFAELQKKHAIVDTRAEAKELLTAREYFKNAEFTAAQKHFENVRAINKNSYSAQYFVSLCDIYLHETEDDFDVMKNIVEMLRSSLIVMSRSDADVADKLKFLTAMLSEIKIIVTQRLCTRDDLFENEIDTFRKLSISDLSSLLELFKIDRELIMSYSPEVKAALYNISECAVKVCYKAVQTVAVGEELLSPSDEEYKKLLSLCNEYCFLSHELNEQFDAMNYSPDFTQNNMLNDKVLSRFAKFDESNANAKKNTIGDINEYNNILAECEKALKFTYLSCYRSMCSKQVEQHSQLFFTGLQMLYRLLLPRIVINDKKQLEIHAGKFVDMVDHCDMLTRFIVDSYELDDAVGESLHEFYDKLYEIIDMYITPELDKIGKSMNKIKETRDNEYFIYQKLLFDGACCCVPALKKYVDFSDGRDKSREKLVRICKEATEDFLVLSDFKVEELEQSNFYRPILQISSAVLDEEDE